VRQALGRVIKDDFGVAVLGERADGSLERLEVTYPGSAPDAEQPWRGRVVEAVEAKTGVSLGAEWLTTENRVVLTRLADLPTRVLYPVPDGPLAEDRVPMAVGRGRVIEWDLIHPHLLMVGKTRSGKTVALTSTVMGLLLRGHEVWICDPKATDLAGVARWPGVTRAAFVDSKAMSDLLVAAAREALDRYDRIRGGRVKARDLRRLVVVVDEAAVLTERLSDWWALSKGKDPRKVPPGIQAWKEIARLGAEARVHLVLGIQQANGKVLDGTEARENFGARAAFGRLSGESSEMAFGRQDVGRKAPKVRGRAFWDVGDEEHPVEGQGYLCPVPEPDGTVDPGDESLLRALLARVADAQGAVAAAEEQAVEARGGQAPLPLPGPAPRREQVAAEDVYAGDDVEFVLEDGARVAGVVSSDPVLEPGEERVLLSLVGREEALSVPADLRVSRLLVSPSR
jgi:DNA segregation ATPase FtsK/SpoIIIE, S-DNA-T family